MQASDKKSPDLFTIINTNARSLAPKISSFIDCFKEMEANIAVITETWFRDGPELDEALDDLYTYIKYNKVKPSALMRASQDNEF